MRASSVTVLAASLLLATACFRTESERVKKAAPDARPGGTLTVGIGPPGSLEPSNAFDPMGQLVIRTMCDPLIQLDPVTGVLEPAIAESWQIVDNGARFTLKLRKGVRFTNGQELKADDVVFSLSRVADREYASSVAELLRPVARFEEIHGEVETDNEELLKKLGGVRATEAYGVEIELKEPRADFIRVLTHPLASPIPKKKVTADPDAFARKPICAGPYRMVDAWDPSKSSIKLERFRGYYGKNLAFTRGGAGYPDRIEFRVDPNADAAYAAQRAGNSDLAEVPAFRVGEVRSNPGYSQVTSPTLEYIGLPIRSEPFNDRDVRIALSQAIDRKALVNSVFGGGRLPATGFLPPSVGDVYRTNSCALEVPAQGALDAARSRLQQKAVSLAESKLKIYFNDEFSNRKMLEAVAASWKAAFGLDSELVPMSWDDYLARASGQSPFDGAFRMSWAAEYPSPDRYLFPLFGSGSIGQNNFTRFSNETFDRLLRRSARRAETEADIRVEYRRLEKIVCQQMPVVPLTFGAREYVADARVGSATGSFGDVTTGEPAVRELYVRGS